MEPKFSGPAYTVGIEEELMILDPDTLRAGQRDRRPARGLARRRDQAGADGVRARDLDQAVRGPARGGRGAARAATSGSRHRRQEGPAHRLGGHAPARALGGPADHRRAALPRPRRRAALRRAPGDHLRPARPHRPRRSRQGDPRRQRDARARADPARAVGELAVLARRRHRPGVGADADLPRLPARRHPARTTRTGRTSRSASASWSRPA